MSLLAAGLAAVIALVTLLIGGKPERYCAGIILAGVAIDRVLHQLIGPRSFSEFDLSRLLIDLFQLVLFLAVALRANRVYPLAIVAAQLMAIIGSIAVLVVPNGWNQAYWAMTQLPALLQMLLLACGIFAHSRRVNTHGRYNCWSPRAGAGPSRMG